MTEIEILDNFGKLFTKAFDKSLAFSKNDLDDLRKHRFKNLFSNMTSEQKTEFEKVSFNMLSGLLFGVLQIFEDNREYKIVYEADNKQVDLVKISEMLKAEPTIEGGWIDRFSKYGETNL